MSKLFFSLGLYITLLCSTSCFSMEKSAQEPPKVVIGVLTANKAVPSWYYASALLKLFTSSSVKAIILALDLGVEAYALAQALRLDIHMLKKLYPKPIIAYAEIALRGAGYIAACACDMIIVSPVAALGSVGLSSIYKQEHEKDAEEGIAYDFIYSGTYKNQGRNHIPLTPEYLQLVQKELVAAYQTIIEDIKTSRPHLATQDTWQKTIHKTLLAKHALAEGLIDAIGDKIDLMHAICQRIGVPVDNFASLSFMTVDPAGEQK